MIKGLVAAAVTVTGVSGFGYTEVGVPSFCDDNVLYGAAHMDFDWLFAQNSYWSPNATLYALYHYGEGTYGVFPHEAFAHGGAGGAQPSALNFAGGFVSGTAGGFTCIDQCPGSRKACLGFLQHSFNVVEHETTANLARTQNVLSSKTSVLQSSR